MKNKKTNRIIILSLIGIILFISLLIFILNYSRDDSSFSILEKKWINDNKDKVVDISVYNDVPIYGKNGSGVTFSMLNSNTPFKVIGTSSIFIILYSLPRLYAHTYPSLR